MFATVVAGVRHQEKRGACVAVRGGNDTRR